MRLYLPSLSRQLKVLLFSSFIAFQAGAATVPDGVTETSTVEGISEFRLGNGLRILLAPDDSKPTTTVNMTYLVGSRMENYGETGMAHLLEHMLFKGTPTTRNALGEFNRRGLQANGSTSSDRTNFFASFAANPDTLKWYLGWQADAMVNSLIARADLDTEMPVVRNEMERGENSPFNILMQKMQGVAYQWHSYGKVTIGARSDVENVDIDQLRAFYHQYYQPDNAVLIVAGKFDPDSTLQAISETLGKLPKPSRKLRREYTVEPVQDGERAVTLRRVGGTPLVAAMYHIPAAASPDFAPLDLATTILSSEPSGRLYHDLVTRKLAAGTFGFTMDQLDPGIAMFGAQLEPSMNQDVAMKTLTATLESVKQKPFTQEELDRARSRWLIDWDRTYSDPERIGVALSEAIASGDWRLFFLERDRVRAAKLPDVQRVAEQYFLRSNRIEGRYIPTTALERAPANTRVDLSAVLKDYKGDPANSQAAAFDASPANINQQTLRRTLDLPNGKVDLALLSKPTRGHRAHAKLLLQFGNEQTLRGQRTVADAVADLLTRGAGKLSRQAIDDRFDQLKADVHFSGSGTNLSVVISTTRENLPAAVSLALEVIRNANFPKDQVDEYKTQVTTAIQNAMTEPPALALRTLARHDNPWPKDDIRYVPTFDESLASVRGLTRDKLVAFHKKFYGTGTIAFSAVGDFDADAVQAALKKSLAGWQRGAPYTRIATPYHAVPAKDYNLETPDKANAFFAAYLPLKVQDTAPDYPALYLANYLLGSSGSSRLWDRIREKDGLSYDVGSTLDISSFEPQGSWTMRAIYAPQNRDRLQQALYDETTRVLKDGFTAQELKDGVNSLHNYFRLAYSQDGVVADTWIRYIRRGRDFTWVADMDRKIAGLTLEQVNEAMRKYFDQAAFTTVYAGDFDKYQGKAEDKAEKQDKK
ncbi:MULTISPECIES: pitrilysin family protein [unclassified Achromobacter]|uniref:M16 family metallopeptidase n=1 Tax=unclassified Achromobacter TaxID=2626865 RepID=UPI000B51B83D|nr:MULTISPECIES: pitrilysin family protein [unclassified Achromobacter]OWT72838.1 peptidase M16 [Achromobacter sp. HZ34]OWT74056.1 peptidase M16 [Achromobacter sp. HZ28]